VRPWLGSRRAVDVLALDDLPQCSNRGDWSNGVLFQAIWCTTLVSLGNGNLDSQRQSLVPLPSQGPSDTALYLSRLRLGGRSGNGCRRRSAVAVERSALVVDGVGCHGRGPRRSRDSLSGLGQQIGAAGQKASRATAAAASTELGHGVGTLAIFAISHNVWRGGE